MAAPGPAVRTLRAVQPLTQGPSPVEGTSAYTRANRLDPYLEGGALNRYYLSLRSGIPSQVDWALSRLTVYTYDMAEKFLLSQFPGMADALAEYVRRWCAAKRGLPRSAWDQMQRGELLNGYRIDQGIGYGDDGSQGLALASVRLTASSSKARRLRDHVAFQPHVYAQDAALERRAADAMLILRNLSLTPENVAFLAQVPGILELIWHTVSLDDVDECVDIPLHMLEILECVAPHMMVSDWVREKFVQAAAVDGPKYLEDRIFARLYEYVQTTDDRAYLLGALRCLRALASHPSNASALAEVDPTLQPTSLQLMSRCLMLLPLTQDPELLEASLDLLYQLVAIGDNALALGLQLTAPRTHAVVQFLTRNLSLGKSVWERDTPLTANATAWWAPDIPNMARIKQRREMELRERMTAEERARWKVLPADIQATITAMPEPQRGIEWMKTLFEPDAQGEVTQMDFWIAYRDQFTPAAQAGAAPLQPAANLIRNVSQAFPGASAMVIQGVQGAQPRFVIRGIAPRLRYTPTPQCPWPGSAPTTTWAEVRTQLEAMVAQTTDGVCRCVGCPFVATEEEEEARRATLRRHVLTHLPPPREPADRAPSAAMAMSTQEYPGVISFDVERTPSVPTALPGEPPSPCGAAFLSLLVLRFVTRAAADVLRRHGYGCPNYTYGGAMEPVRAASERGELFGFPMAPLAGGDSATSKADGASDQDERWTNAAIQIMEAVAGVEEELMAISLRNDILCRLANDTLIAIRPHIAPASAAATEDM